MVYSNHTDKGGNASERTGGITTMKDKELRRIIGGRAKQRRLELGVNQPYVAEKMGVTASTIQRYREGRMTTLRNLSLTVWQTHSMFP